MVASRLCLSATKLLRLRSMRSDCYAVEFADSTAVLLRQNYRYNIQSLVAALKLTQIEISSISHVTFWVGI